MRPTGPERNRASAAIVTAVILIAVIVNTRPARAAWDQIARFLSLQGSPEPASASVLSEHETEALDSMPPQSQAELLMERSINHYAGANDEIARRVTGWRGRVTPGPRLGNPFVNRIKSHHLPVPAPAVQGGNAARDLEKTAP